MHYFFALLYGTAGVAHFFRPHNFDAIVPPQLPGSARLWTYASGVAELAVAAMMVRPGTRRAAGYASAVLLLAVYPANITMAWEWRHKPAWQQAIAYVRLPLQIPLITRSVRVAREATPRTAVVNG